MRTHIAFVQHVYVDYLSEGPPLISFLACLRPLVWRNFDIGRSYSRKWFIHDMILVMLKV
jgi:hypothetical protein